MSTTVVIMTTTIVTKCTTNCCHAIARINTIVDNCTKSDNCVQLSSSFVILNISSQIVMSDVTHLTAISNFTRTTTVVIQLLTIVCCTLCNYSCTSCNYSCSNDNYSCTHCNYSCSNNTVLDDARYSNCAHLANCRHFPLSRRLIRKKRSVLGRLSWFVAALPGCASRAVCETACGGNRRFAYDGHQSVSGGCVPRICKFLASSGVVLCVKLSILGCLGNEVSFELSFKIPRVLIGCSRKWPRPHLELSLIHI